MSETYTSTIEKPLEDPALQAEVVTSETGQTSILYGNETEPRQKPWNYEELGGEEIAAEQHEANLDWATGLGAQVDGVLGEADSLETPAFSVTRSEIPRPTATDGQPGYRYDFQLTKFQSRTNLTLTMMDGRPEVTVHIEPTDTAAHPADIAPTRYVNGSWAPEDVGMHQEEDTWNEVFAGVGDALKEAARAEQEKTRLKQRGFGRKVLEHFKPV